MIDVRDVSIERDFLAATSPLSQPAHFKECVQWDEANHAISFDQTTDDGIGQMAIRFGAFHQGSAIRMGRHNRTFIAIQRFESRGFIHVT